MHAAPMLTTSSQSCSIKVISRRLSASCLTCARRLEAIRWIGYLISVQARQDSNASSALSRSAKARRRVYSGPFSSTWTCRAISSNDGTSLHSRDHRFFFALLLNLDDRERILGLLRERYPDEDPVEKILDWVFDLSQTRILGKDNDNALGVRDFGPAEMFVLEGILRGKNGDQIVAEHAGENADVAPETIPDAIQKLRDSLTFRPLMA